MTVDNFDEVASAVYYVLIDAWVAMSQAILSRVLQMPIADKSETSVKQAEMRVSKWSELLEDITKSNTQQLADQSFQKLKDIINSS